MSLTLQATDDDLKRKFFNLKTREDVADLLEITHKHLVYLLYQRNQPKHYKTFTIKKKSGDTREIHAPISTIKILQKKLNYIFNLVYQVKDATHGYAKERSVVTNSLLHIGKKYILNIDLKDFFPSIHFGRIRALLKAKPYSLSHQAAETLAQICTYQSYLPQGAPSSPTISNMICAKLDNQLSSLARRNKCAFTRYADDLTFSTNLKYFPDCIARRAVVNGKLKVIIGEELGDIIERNYFAINMNKVSMLCRASRQQVTGIIVNEKPNVRRSYVRKIRAMLYAWLKYGLKLAEKEMHEKYLYKQYNPLRKAPSFKKVLEGKINYLKNVRGSDDGLYLRYFNKMCLLNGEQDRIILIELKDSIDFVWVLECGVTFLQGSGFMLKDVGLVTCSHVIEENTKAFRLCERAKESPVTIIKQNKDLDLIVLKIDGNKYHSLRNGDSDSVKQGDELTIVGFPNYSPGVERPAIMKGHVTNIKIISGIRYFIVDSTISKGYSGGPVLNTNNEVIGVASGGYDPKEKNYTTENKIIDIGALSHLKDK